MKGRRAVAMLTAVVMAGFLFGISGLSLAAEKTVILKVPGCV